MGNWADELPIGITKYERVADQRDAVDYTDKCVLVKQASEYVISMSYEKKKPKRTNQSFFSASKKKQRKLKEGGKTEGNQEEEWRSEEEEAASKVGKRS